MGGIPRHQKEVIEKKKKKMTDFGWVADWLYIESLVCIESRTYVGDRESTVEAEL